MLGGRKQWLHILGISQLIWAVALTAIQRGIQASIGSGFTISFDSSTPFLSAGKYQRYPKPPKLTKDIRTWQFSSVPFPVGYAAATVNSKKPFPTGSPLSGLLTLGDMNPDPDPYSARTFNTFSQHALGNHNAYVFIRAFIEANKKGFVEKVVPQEIDDMIGNIDELFSSENWSSLLDSQGQKMEAMMQTPKSDKELDDEIAY
jgi:hypothetical protein